MERRAKKGRRSRRVLPVELRGEGRYLRALAIVEKRYGVKYPFATETTMRRQFLNREWSREMLQMAKQPGAEFPWNKRWDDEREEKHPERDPDEEEHEKRRQEEPKAPGDHHGPHVLREVA